MLICSMNSTDLRWSGPADCGRAGARQQRDVPVPWRAAGIRDSKTAVMLEGQVRPTESAGRTGAVAKCRAPATDLQRAASYPNVT